MIWLIGRSGMLGRLVEQELRAHNLEYAASGPELDVTRPDSIDHFAPKRKPRWVINCSGYTAVDSAESEEDQAWAVNRDGPALLARYCQKRGARLLHISTDYVFDGSLPDGYGEDAEPSPINVYGASKAGGEEEVRAELREHVIVRTAWLFAEHGRNFVLTILRLLKTRGELTVVDDQHGSPTYGRDLARAIVLVVTASRPVYGTFHFTNSGVTTWHGFASAIRDRAVELGLIPKSRRIVRVSSDQFPTAAERPSYSVLTCRRMISAYGFEPRTWEEALDDCLQRIASEHQARTFTLV